MSFSQLEHLIEGVQVTDRVHRQDECSTERGLPIMLAVEKIQDSVESQAKQID